MIDHDDNVNFCHVFSTLITITNCQHKFYLFVYHQLTCNDIIKTSVQCSCQSPNFFLFQTYAVKRFYIGKFLFRFCLAPATILQFWTFVGFSFFQSLGRNKNLSHDDDYNHEHHIVTIAGIIDIHSGEKTMITMIITVIFIIIVLIPTNILRLRQL